MYRAPAPVSKQASEYIASESGNPSKTAQNEESRVKIGCQTHDVVESGGWRMSVLSRTALSRGFSQIEGFTVKKGWRRSSRVFSGDSINYS
jgi:hypothetical protein